MAAWDDVLLRYRTPPASLGDLEAAALAVSLLDVIVRDTVAGMWSGHRDALPQVLMEVCRRTPAPYDAPACTVLAWVTYAAGGGALVTVALTRALESDPTYSMAGLLAEALSGQVDPAQVRRILRSTRKVLKAR